MKMLRLATLLLATCVLPLQAAPPADSSNYLGEIRRDSNGKLIAVPAAPDSTGQATTPPPAAPAPAAPRPPQGKTATPEAAIKSNAPAASKTIRVGPTQEVRRISDAARLARDGDTVEIESGDYPGDVAIWKQNNLMIRGVGTKRPRLMANGTSAEGKGIWVLRGGKITVENLEFSGARVPDSNGAGIRHELGHLIVRNCRFTDNENGILTNGGEMQLEIENSEFDHNGALNGRSHNIYIGKIQKFKVTGSYFHHARAGHLLKSRAAENHILYNRLTDETDGRASYELEFPNGGAAFVIGNIIEQSAKTENTNIISYGAEGYRAENNVLYLINNTIVDNRPDNGNILVVKGEPRKVVIMNNLLVTRRKLEIKQEAELGNNLNADWDQFALASHYDFRLKASSSLLGKYLMPASVNGISLIPQREYVHPAGSRTISGATRQPGAMQSLSP